MVDSTPERPSPRVERWRKAHAELMDKQTNRLLQNALAECEKDLTVNDWRWIRGEWHR